MSSIDPTPTTGRRPRPDPSNFPGGGGGGGNGGGGGGGGGNPGRGGKREDLLCFPICSNDAPTSRQPDVKSLPLHVSWFVHLEQHSKPPPVTLPDHPLSATLLLLLAISLVIVGRSVVVRRRARRMIEEAVRNGTWLPQAGRPVINLGEKPKLFDVHTTMNGIPGRSPPDDSLLAWGGLKARLPSSAPSEFNECSPDVFITQPLSATLEKPVSPSHQTPVVRLPAPTEPPPSLLFRLVPQLRPPPRVATLDPSALPLETRQPPHDTTLTVSVMIAMPTPLTTKPRNSFQDTFPPVQVGITHLQIPRGWTMGAKSESS